MQVQVFEMVHTGSCVRLFLVDAYIRNVEHETPPFVLAQAKAMSVNKSKMD